MRYTFALLMVPAIAQAQIWFDQNNGSAPAIYNTTVLPTASQGVTPSTAVVPVGALARTSEGAVCLRIGSSTAASSFINLTSSTVTVASLGLAVAPVPSTCKF